MSRRRVLFIDASALGSPLRPRVIPSLLKLQDEGFRLVLTSETTEAELLASQGVTLETAPGEWEQRGSRVISERTEDLAFAARLGLDAERIPADGWTALVDKLLAGTRRAEVTRRTKETQITARVDLDGTGKASIRTGIGYFDHMIEQIAKHGGFDLTLEAKGDLEVDEHHTVEDVALTLGECLDRALGARIGIGRYGFLLPMDEAEAQVALDLSGRAYLVFDGTFQRERVGELPTEMVPHFFRSLSDSLRATLHVRVTGENDHHKVEACFKSVGRALRQAIGRTAEGGMPSTKGVL